MRVMAMFAPVLTLALVLGFAPAALADSCASVEREMTYGRVALQDAKGRAGYLESARQFEAAVAKAPKCAKARFNLGVVYEKAGAYRKALAAFQAYLRLAPGASDAKTVKTKIYELEYRAKKAKQAARTRKTKRAARAKKPPPPPKVDWSSFAGDWCHTVRCSHPEFGRRQWDFHVTIRGNRIEARRRGLLPPPAKNIEQIDEFQGTIDGKGGIKGQYTTGLISENPHSRCKVTKGTRPFEGKLTKERVTTDKGRVLTGGTIIFSYWVFSSKVQNCRSYRINSGPPAFYTKMYLRRR